MAFAEQSSIRREQHRRRVLMLILPKKGSRTDAISTHEQKIVEVAVTGTLQG
jgi:hypothetical protein